MPVRLVKATQKCFGRQLFVNSLSQYNYKIQSVHIMKVAEPKKPCTRGAFVSLATLTVLSVA